MLKTKLIIIHRIAFQKDKIFLHQSKSKRLLLSTCFCGTGSTVCDRLHLSDSLPLNTLFILLAVSVRDSSGAPSRKTSTPLTPVSTMAAASSTRSPVTSANCAASRSASPWAWPWIVSDLMQITYKITEHAKPHTDKWKHEGTSSQSGNWSSAVVLYL